jgi:predicted ATP-dependent serine protease
MRPVSQLEQRISEAARLGFTSLAVPKQSMEKSGNSTGSVHQVADVAGLMQIVFD